MTLTKTAPSWGVASLCSGLGIGVPRLGMAGYAPFLFTEVISMYSVILSIVIVASSIWVYLDATKNDIGKIEGEKGFFNLHAGGWALVVLLLWIVGFPAYLIKRSDLIKKAHDYPAEVSGKTFKIIALSLCGLVIIIGQLSQADLSDSPLASLKLTKNNVSCTNDDVQELVMQIVNEEMFKQLLPDAFTLNSPKILEEVSSYLDGLPEEKKSSQQIDQNKLAFYMMQAMSNGGNGNIPVDEFMKMTKISNTAKELRDKIYETIKSYGLTINAIRIKQKNPDLKKITCTGDITSSNGNRHTIDYSAQLTEDGQIYVEVSGL